MLNPVYGVPQGFPGTVFANQDITQKQLGVYAQDQMKLGRLTLVLSGRNDWVNTFNENHLAPNQERDDNQFSGRAGLIYNTDLGIAPYVSYATSFNPIIGTNFVTGKLFARRPAYRPKSASRSNQPASMAVSGSPCSISSVRMS